MRHHERKVIATEYVDKSTVLKMQYIWNVSVRLYIQKMETRPTVPIISKMMVPLQCFILRLSIRILTICFMETSKL